MISHFNLNNTDAFKEKHALINIIKMIVRQCGKDGQIRIQINDNIFLEPMNLEILYGNDEITLRITK